MSGRSPEEREAARLERERKRAQREGRPFPEPAPAPSEVAPEPDPGLALEDMQSGAPAGPQTDSPPVEEQATQQWDVETELANEPPAAPRPEPAQPPAEPARPEPAPPTEQYDVVADWTGEHAVTTAAVEADALDAEVPLGTRRVAPHEHPRLAARAAKPPRGGGRGRTPSPPAPPNGASATRPPSAPRPPRRIGRRVVALTALALIVVAGWFLVSLYQPFAGDAGGSVVVRVPAGAGVGEIGDLLAAKGVISSSFFFRLRARIAGDTGDLKTGRFVLHEDMTYAAALEALTKNPPPPPTIDITLPEGPSRAELAPRIKQAGLSGDYVALTRSSKLLSPRRYGAPKGATLEGFLFPATYELKRKATAKDLVAAQLAAFKQNLATVDLRYARSKNLTVFDVVTIAAMVEREVAVAKERPLVAAVIYNRLRQGIPLGIDATLRFGLGNWSSPLKVSELESETPYNTRNHQGLPPGPIGNPGLASLKAAAHPAKVDYLFYVVKPGTCGEHAFSSTDAEFQQDVARYNAAREAAGGKSPTKC